MEVNTRSQPTLKPPARSIQPPFLEALPSASLTLPQFASEIAESDDRLLQISQTLNRILTESRAKHDPAKGTSIEIEGKLTSFVFYETPLGQQIRDATQQRYWSLLKPMKGVYKVDSGLADGNEADTFANLLRFMQERAREGVLRESFIRTKDETVDAGN